MKKIDSVDFIQSPLYWGKDYEGFDVDLYDLLIVAVVNGKEYTHKHNFGANMTMVVEAFVDKIRNRGAVDLSHWWEGNPWDRYKTPQTYEEEKEQALEFERDNLRVGW